MNIMIVFGGNMKIFTVLIMTLCAAAVMCSCSNSTEKDSSSKGSAASENAVTEAPEESASTETFTLPSRETFAQLPAEAEESFDYVIQAVKKSHPSEEKGSKRLYGYLGVEEINDCSCYLFAVYDEKKDVHTEVATVAVTEDSSELYIYNSDTLTYEVLEVPEGEDDTEEYHWAEDSSCDTESRNENPDESSAPDTTDDSQSVIPVEVTLNDSSNA